MKPTMELRWYQTAIMDDFHVDHPPPILQQKWVEMEYYSVSLGYQTEARERETGKFEWRDVPTVEGAI